MKFETEINIITEIKAKKQSLGGANLDDTWERKVKLDCPMYSKQANSKGVYSWNKMWSLKRLVMLKYESRTDLHIVQYMWHPGSVLMFCSYYFKKG